MSGSRTAFCCPWISPFEKRTELPHHRFLEAFHKFGHSGQSSSDWTNASACQEGLVIRLSKYRPAKLSFEPCIQWFEVFTSRKMDDSDRVVGRNYFFRKIEEVKARKGEYKLVSGTELTFDCAVHGIKFDVEICVGQSAGHVEFRGLKWPRMTVK